MKPAGPIPPGFARLGQELAIGGRRVSELIAEAGGTPLFVYDRALVAAKVAAFRAAFPGVRLHYAVKANPFAPLVTAMQALVDGFDVASAGEIAVVRGCGIDGGAVSFAGPGKRDSDLALAIREGVTINAESRTQVARSLALGEAMGRAPRIAVRVNPDFEIKGSGMRMGGGARPFGVDAEDAADVAKAAIAGGAVWRGWHIFAGSQALDPAALIAAQEATVSLAERLTDAVGLPCPHLNLGGGFGIPYAAKDSALDIAPIGAALTERLARSSLSDCAFAIEVGRWLVGESGVYLTRIIERKVSRGKVFLVVDGGLQHQLAASGNFGQAIRRNYPVALASRFDAAGEEVASVVGCLCTPLDLLADEVLLPVAEAGDVVAVFLAGAYGLTASPQAFLAQEAAREMLV